MTTDGVYLLHFDPPYRHAGHYLGWSDDIARRVAEHQSGNGKSSPLVRAAIAAGSVVTLARTWPGATRTFERRLKHHGKARSCPLCPGPTRNPR